jgi:subtilisin family serine protease
VDSHAASSSLKPRAMGRLSAPSERPLKPLGGVTQSEGSFAVSPVARPILIVVPHGGLQRWSIYLHVEVSVLSNEPIRLVKLDLLMQRSGGVRDVVIGLIDGPVAIDHPDLATSNIQVTGSSAGVCSVAASVACQHGTFVAGILAGRRGPSAPAICPDCTLLLRPIFPEAVANNDGMPGATPLELAAAIREAVEAGAWVINLSAALLQPTMTGVRKLQEALDFAAARGTITVAAAGNQGTVGSSAITRHPWVIPVAGCRLNGQPLSRSNFGNSIGRRGLCAPAEEISSLGSDGQPRLFGGTSAAAPFVTGTIALLWSEFPSATAGQIKSALLQVGGPRRSTVVPPLLDAAAAYQSVAAARKYQ